MTAYEFMVNAFYISVGMVCLSFSALVACGAAIGVYRALKGKREEK